MARDKRFEMRLSEAEYVQVVERARQDGTTVSGVVRKALGLAVLPLAGEKVVSDGRRDKIVEDRLPKGIEDDLHPPVPIPEDPFGLPAATRRAVALSKLIKRLEAQGNPNAEEVARKRLGM